MLPTQEGVEEIVPGLSTWTAEDLVEAGAWDDELRGYADLDVEQVESEDEPQESDDFDPFD